MTSALQHRISRIGRQVASGALALAVVLALTVVATQSAPAQTFTVLHSFSGHTDGAHPWTVIRDKAGNLYGTTERGGGFNGSACQSGCGMVFKLDSNGQETVLYRFPGRGDGEYPQGRLVRDGAGNLYGTTRYGGMRGGTCLVDWGCGVVFKLDPAGKETVLYRFTGSDGAGPWGDLLRDQAGNLYGATEVGGDACGDPGCGVVFKLDPTGKLTVLHHFTGGADGAEPGASLIRDEAGNLYGITLGGGPDFAGVVFTLDPTGNETVLYRFTGGADGASPAALVRDAAGNLYGVTVLGGDSHCKCGVLFMVDSSGKETVLYRFTGQPDGKRPSSLALGAAGNLYGTAYAGPSSGFYGTVFEFDTTGKETTIYRFTGPDGRNPNDLIADHDGNLYGTTYYGGQGGCRDGCGTVFKLTP